MINVRKTKNAKFIMKLNKQIFPDDPLEINTGSHMWLLNMNDVPAGFATMRGLQYDPDTVYFDRAGLKPIARGHGLHRRLINVRLRYASRLGFRRAITYCLDDNLASGNNLIKCGFQLYEPQYRWADSRSKKEVLYFIRNL